MKRDKTEFIILPAFHGDCILIKTFDNKNDEFVILIDGGTSQTFRHSLKTELKNISKINLLILTHIDSDHIGGLISLFKSSLIDNIDIEEIWMNHPELVEVSNENLISTKQGDSLKALIFKKKPNVTLNQISTVQGLIFKAGIEFIILSPTDTIINELYRKWQSTDLASAKEKNVNISAHQDSYSESMEILSRIPFSPDKKINDDIFNSSSIAFILKCYDTSMLLLADSRPEVICESLRVNGFSEDNPLEIDYVKVSHHGSTNNTSQEQLSLVKSNNFIISTNGGTARHKHPAKETIARIIYNSQRTKSKLNVYFNYPIDSLKQRIGNFISSGDIAEGNWQVATKNRF